MTGDVILAYMHICVCSLELADKCVPGHWPEESEAKLGHLVLQPGTDQSAGLPLAIVFFPLSPHMNTHIHPRTDRQASPLCAVSAEPWWPLWGSHAGGDGLDTLFHHDMLALFLHSGENLVSSFPPLRGKWNQALWALFKCKNTLWRIHKLISMQKRIPAVKGKMQRYFSVRCLLSCMKSQMLVWISMAGFGCSS